MAPRLTDYIFIVFARAAGEGIIRCKTPHRRPKLSLWLATIVAILTNALLAQDSKEAIERAIEVKYDAIMEELKDIGEHPWAGKYSWYGEDDENIICIAPTGGLVNITIYQQHEKSFHDSGSVQFDGQILKVKWDHSGEGGRFNSLGDELVVVVWDSVHILVPRGEVHGFCLLYHGREHYWKTGHLSHFDHVRTSDDPGRFLRGEPQLPEELSIFWGLPEIVGQVTYVAKATLSKQDDVRKYVQTGTINKGSADHLYVGMKLMCSAKKHSWEIRVTKVEANSSTFEYVLRIKKGRFTPIPVGATVRSK